MEAITSFDQVPAALNYLINEVGILKKALAERDSSTSEPDKWFNLEEFCKYHPAKPAPTTVYGWVSRRAVPHKHDGKHLLFLKSEIDSWLKEKGRKTTAEIEALARQHPTRSRNQSSVTTA
ncbi:helix-turn-helix domain-containing protein [Spirosoma foliorum]|uniref:Helix-turn-helix domain-containing protein n=1 Tax=Spirosoma foliorum TaxID=2710596 RepID=A0A7G5GTV8_9BACT|nr:helix-turn-helix domain-containing protein [Spirosoma foliorum]QMW02300.1 helix-turn-helix domain-containing protein [Spirosoma foliorum]